MEEWRRGGSGNYKSRSQGPFTENTRVSHVMDNSARLKGIDTSVRRPRWGAPSREEDCRV